jgi:dephospho-CoA kinase
MASHSQRPQGERLFVGITGRIGSGKTTVGKYLESRYGFQYLRYSAELAEWLAKNSESKVHLQKIGWEVMSSGKQAELNRRLIAQINPDADVAVDGLRHPLDYEALNTNFYPSFYLVYIDSPTQLRFDRLKEKGKYADLGLFQTADSHPVEQKIESLQANAALVIRNQSSIQDLYANLDKAVHSFRKEGQ